MENFNKIYKKARRTFTRNKATWDESKDVKAFYLKGTSVAVVDLEETTRIQGKELKNINYKYNVMSDKKPAIPCDTEDEVLNAIKVKLKEK